jgi:hypothetical protein
MLDTMEYMLSHGQKCALRDTSQDSQAMAMYAEVM